MLVTEPSANFVASIPEANLTSVTAASIIFIVLTESSANLAEVIAPVATSGNAAVPPKSPAN